MVVDVPEGTLNEGVDLFPHKIFFIKKSFFKKKALLPLFFLIERVLGEVGA